MKYEKIKLFKNSEKQIVSLPYDDDADYYAFLRECRAAGYSQIIISSEMMIRIIKHACLEKHYTVYRIEFIEQDSDLENEIKNILKNIEGNAGYLSVLLEKLNFLAEKSSIDLKRVYIKEKYVSGKVPDNFFVQTNGIVGINKESMDLVLSDISALIEGCL